MRMSCNGCRVLRKGCGENCSIRPCLQWIKCPQSQANATVFLAKFYGRAGLINLLNAGPEHLRPEIFRSLLYEACGRIVNPIYGSVGLLWSENWSLCHNAVEAVLNGAPIIQMASDSAECNNGPPLQAYDIRHVNLSGSKYVPRVRTRPRFKKSAAKPRTSIRCDGSTYYELNLCISHDSSLSRQSTNGEGESPDVGSLASSETAEGLTARKSQFDSESVPEPNDAAVDGEVELDLSLGLEPVSRSRHKDPKKKTMDQSCGSSGGGYVTELGFVQFNWCD